MSSSDSRPAGVAPLSVETDLSLAIDGGEADVESTGRRLIVSFHSVPDAVRALRGRPADAEDELSALLAVTDLTVEIRARDRILAVAGPDTRPGVLSNLIDVSPVELRLGGAVGAVVAEAKALVR